MFFPQVDQKMPIYESILKTVGRTPVVRLNRLAPAGRLMFAKCEYFNPLSSIKVQILAPSASLFRLVLLNT